MVWLFFTYGLVEERGGRSREAGRRDLLFNRARIGSEDENDLATRSARLSSREFLVKQLPCLARSCSCARISYRFSRTVAASRSHTSALLLRPRAAPPLTESL